MAQDKTRIRAVHDIAAGVFMGVYLDDIVILSELPYKTVSDYMIVDSGDHILSTGMQCPPGTQCELDTSADRFSVSGLVYLEPGVSYTVVIYGDKKANLLVLEDYKYN